MNVLIRKGNNVFKAEIAKNFFDKVKGLMFSGKKNILFFFDQEGFYGIHSFFVFFPFDAIYLDSNKKIVDIIRKIAPFTLYVRNKKPAKYLLELTEKNNLKIGDVLGW